MSDKILHIRIKEKYAASIIEVLFNENAIEIIEEENIELTAQQKEALEKEVEMINNKQSYLQKWDDIRHGFKRD